MTLFLREGYFIHRGRRGPSINVNRFYIGISEFLSHPLSESGYGECPLTTVVITTTYPKTVVLLVLHRGLGVGRGVRTERTRLSRTQGCLTPRPQVFPPTSYHSFVRRLQSVTSSSSSSLI